MPAILFTSNSSITDVQSPARRSKPDRSKTRTIHTMHSSRQGYKPGASTIRSSPFRPSMTATSSTSTALPSIPAVVPKTSPHSQKTPRPSSGKQSFSPLLSAPSPPSTTPTTPSMPRPTSATSASSITSLSSAPSAISSTTSVSGSSIGSKNSVNEAYRRRYASYLASTFNMSMDAALREADLQLLPRAGCDGNRNMCEAELYRD